MSETFINNYTVVVGTGGIDSSSTSLPVSAAASVASGFRILVGTELMLVTAGGTTTTWTVTRHIEGTTAASHISGDTIYIVMTAGGLTNLVGQWQAGVTDTVHSGTSDPAIPEITLVQSALSAENALSVAYSSSVTAGNILFAYVGRTANTLANPPIVTDTVGTIWTQCARYSDGYWGVAVLYGVAGASGSNTVTVAGTPGNSCRVIIAEFSGNLTTTIDVENGGVSPTPIAVTQAYDFILTAGFTTTGFTTTGLYPTVSGIESIIQGFSAYWDVSGGLCYGIYPATTPFTSSLYTGGGYPGGVYVSVAFKCTVPNVGNDGDWYINTTDKVLWGPRIGGLYRKYKGFVPPGGNTGAVLTKIDTTDYNYYWGVPPTGVVTASSLGAILDCDLSTGNKISGGTATDNTSILQAYISSASSTAPVHLVMDGPSLITGLEIPVGGYVTIVGEGYDTGFYLKNSSSTPAIYVNRPGTLPGSRENIFRFVT